MTLDLSKIYFTRTYDIERIKDLSFLEFCDPNIVKFYEYWSACRNEQGVVLRSKLVPEGMMDLLPRVFIVDREPVSGDYRYKLIGSTELSFRKNNPTGQLVKDGHVGTLSDALDNYDYVFNEKSHLFMSCNVYRSNEYVVTDETLFLPVSRDGREVDFCYALGVQKIDKMDDGQVNMAYRKIFDNDQFGP